MTAARVFGDDSASDAGGAWPELPWTCPDGQRVTSSPGKGTSEGEWLRERDGLVGASEVAMLYGLTSYGDAYTVWTRKTGAQPRTPTTDGQRRGQMLEDAVLDLWVERFADFPLRTRRQGLMRSKRWPHLGATVDRLSVCRYSGEPARCLVEIKTQASMGDWAGDEIPVHIVVQDQAQLAVTGRHHVHNVVLGPRLVPEHRVVFRDEQLIESIGERVEVFWREYVATGNPPQPTAAAHEALRRSLRLTTTGKGTSYTATEDDLPHVHALLDAAAEAAAASTVVDTAKAVLMARMGTATELLWPDGTTIATWRAERTVDGANADWCKAHPELVEAYSVPTTKLDLAKLVENEPGLIESGQLRYRRSFKAKPDTRQPPQ